MQADYFRTLFEYHRWATEKILERAATVDEAGYFALADGLSFGNLHGTLVHALVTDVVWIARFEGRLPPDALKDARRSDVTATTGIPDFATLRRIYSEELAKQARFAAALTDAQAEAPLSYQTQSGEPYSQPLNELMAHFINHGTQFRAEAAVRLTQLSRSPGDLDLIMFLRQRI